MSSAYMFATIEDEDCQPDSKLWDKVEYDSLVLRQERDARIASFQATAIADEYNIATNVLLDNMALAAKLDVGNTMRRQAKDPMRRKPRKLTDEDVANIDRVKRKAAKLWQLLEELEDESTDYGGEFHEAMKRLEEAVMWATKGISA